MKDPFCLQRFIDAQNFIYDNVLHELKKGEKRSCWMWFVFPQVIGLGHTSIAEKYSIKSIDEAKAYIAHPVLLSRLQECSQLVVHSVGRTAKQIFGSPDDLKFRSSMTLFNHIAAEKKIFKDALVKFYEGKEDPLTLEVLERWQKEDG